MNESKGKRVKRLSIKDLKVVGAAGFEPAAPRPPVWCANRAAPRSA